MRRRWDFIGFVLDDCGEHRLFESREPGVEQLALMACEERTRIAVEVDPKDPCRFVELGLLCPQGLLQGLKIEAG